MNILSLFDGISCARVACDRAGIKVNKYWASEIDKYALQVSKKNYPDSIYLGNVKDIYTIDHPIDLIIVGSPCQDLSIAKKNREGLEGSRSSLFYDYVRLVRMILPKYFILENVYSMPKEAMAIISHELFGIEPVMINASLVSAQNRKRLFWVGKRDTSLLSGVTYRQVDISQPEDRGILLWDVLEPKVSESFYVKPKSNTIRPSGRGSGIDDKHNLDTIRIGSINSGGQGDRIYSADGKSVSLSANGGGRGAKTGLYAVSQRGRNIVDGKRKDILGAKTQQRIEIGGTDKAHTITSVTKDSMVMQGSVIRKLTPIECERLQGLPDNYTEGISNTQRYKCLGNAFNVDVVAHILKHLEV